MSADAAMIPNMMVNPIHDQNLSLRAIGRIPRAVVTVVRSIGSSRDDPASTRAVTHSIHFLRFSLIADMRMIPWFTAIPVNAINPIPNGSENLFPVRISQTITNGSDIITEYRTMSGCEKLLNWSVSMANMTIIAIKNADKTAMISSLFDSFSHHFT